MSNTLEHHGILGMKWGIRKKMLKKCLMMNLEKL